MPQIRSNKYRARQAVFLLKIIILFDVVIIFFDFKEFLLLSSLESHLLVPVKEASANDVRQAIIGVLYFVVALCSGIAFLSWFNRAYSNLSRAGIPTDLPIRYPIFCFFIPIVNFYMPYRIMLEIWDKTNTLVNTGKHKHDKVKLKVFNWWWILWLVSIFSAVLYLFTVLTAEGVTDLKQASVFNIISNIIDIPAAMVTITVINHVSKSEGLLFHS